MLTRLEAAEDVQGNGLLWTLSSEMISYVALLILEPPVGEQGDRLMEQNKHEL